MDDADFDMIERMKGGRAETSSSKAATRAVNEAWARLDLTSASSTDEITQKIAVLQEVARASSADPDTLVDALSLVEAHALDARRRLENRVGKAAAIAAADAWRASYNAEKSSSDRFEVARREAIQAGMLTCDDHGLSDCMRSSIESALRYEELMAQRAEAEEKRRQAIQRRKSGGAKSD